MLAILVCATEGQHTAVSLVPLHEYLVSPSRHIFGTLILGASVVIAYVLAVCSEVDRYNM